MSSRSTCTSERVRERMDMRWLRRNGVSDTKPQSNSRAVLKHCAA